jgi:hypothetical protein
MYESAHHESMRCVCVLKTWGLGPYALGSGGGGNEKRQGAVAGCNVGK